MPEKISGSLGDYGVETYKRYHFTCVYCGFDGRPFDSWMQLSIDHIRPKNSKGDNSADNCVVACRACNSITSRMKFDNETREEIIEAKRKRVIERHKKYFSKWQELVPPAYFEMPLPETKI